MKPTPSAPFGRLATAMITPFTSSGTVDHETTWRLARHLSDQGSDTLVVAGTTGESPTLSDDEKIALFATVVESVKEKDTLVVAGTGTYDTRHSVEMTGRASEVGADGVLAVTPYYNKPSQAGQIAHFTVIADVGLPVIVYNIPGRTAVKTEGGDAGCAGIASQYRCGEGRRPRPGADLGNDPAGTESSGLLRPGHLHASHARGGGCWSCVRRRAFGGPHHQGDDQRCI